MSPAMIFSQLTTIEKYKCDKRLGPCAASPSPSASTTKTPSLESSAKLDNPGVVEKSTRTISLINQSGNKISCPQENDSCIENATRQGFLIIPDVSIGIALDWNAKPLRLVGVGQRARQAGLREGDILDELDGVKISEPVVVYKLLAAKRAGDQIVVKIMRVETPITATYQLEARQ
jgi:hypothetical protein